MANEYETLCYHGRRSVDELAEAQAADNDVVALAHKELSLLHLARFVALLTAAAENTRQGRAAKRR